MHHYRNSPTLLWDEEIISLQVFIQIGRLTKMASCVFSGGQPPNPTVGSAEVCVKTYFLPSRPTLFASFFREKEESLGRLRRSLGEKLLSAKQSPRLLPLYRKKGV